MNLQINDIVQTNDNIIGRVVSLDTKGGSVKTDDGKEYWFYPSAIRPILLTDEWLLAHRVITITGENGLEIDFHRTHKLKVSLVDSSRKLQISYFFPKPQYVHELQQILRQFNNIEI